MPHLVLFSKPHDISISIVKYETILIIRTNFDITALLFYFRELIYGYQTCKTCTR